MTNPQEVIAKIRLNRISKSWRFLGVVILLYLLLALRYKYLVLEGLTNTLLVFVKILPVLLWVFVIMFITNIFIEQGAIKKHLSEAAGFKAYLYAVLSGILIVGPPYLLYPLLGDLKRAGMKDSLVAIFMFNSNVKIPFVPVMVFYFGLAYTVIISVLIILFSFLNAYMISKLVRG